jgi:hypothetical protein
MRRWASVTVLSLLLAFTAAGQGPGGGPPKGGGPGGGPGGGGPNPVNSIGKMGEEERRRTIESLPPERRKQAEDRMGKLDRMSPEERERLERSYAAFQRLPAKMQEQARQMYRRLNELPNDRHSAVREEFGHLRAQSSSERTQLLKSKDFRSRYNKKEQAILTDYVTLLEAPLR